MADSRIQIQENFTDLIFTQKESIWSIPVYTMATSQVLDVKTDADYVALRRRMSRLRVQNSNKTDDDDNEEDMSDAMLRDIIKYWKRNNGDIAKRFVKTWKERRAKKKQAETPPVVNSGRRKSVEFEDLDMTKSGLRFKKKREPLHTHKTITRIPETPEPSRGDEVLSVRRPKKTSNQQKMNMVINRSSTKTDMSKAEEGIIKSKLNSAAKFSPPLQRSYSSCGFRQKRVDSGLTRDFRKTIMSESDSFRQRTGSDSPKGSGSPKGCGSPKGSGSPKGCGSPIGSGSPKDIRKYAGSDSNTFRQRSGSNPTKSPHESRKRGPKSPERKKTSTPSVMASTS